MLFRVLRPFCTHAGAFFVLSVAAGRFGAIADSVTVPRGCIIVLWAGSSNHLFPSASPHDTPLPAIGQDVVHMRQSKLQAQVLLIVVLGPSALLQRIIYSAFRLSRSS